MTSAKLYIGACLEPCELGQEFERLPSHVTLVPPFILPSEQIPALHAGMAERAVENPKITIVGGELEDFGSAKEVTVRALGGVMFQLHASSLMLVESLGGSFDERYTGLAWAPHVSHFKDVIAEGERKEIAEYQLFRYLIDGVRIVEAVYSAEGSNVYEA